MFKKNRSVINASPKLKTDPFNFLQIERYFLLVKNKNVLQRISERTFQDLDLEDVFKFVDRTSSSVGQQYLYNLLRTIPNEHTRAVRIENLIKIFENDPELRQTLLRDLSGLNNKDAYYIYSLFLQPYILKPKWFWLIKALSLASVSSVLLSFLFPQLLIGLALLLPVNFGFHYWNKNNLHQYGSSIPQLMRMTALAKKILTHAAFQHSKKSLFESVRMLDKMSLSMTIFKLEARLQSEIGLIIEYLIELIKALFLIEPIILFRTLDKLDSRRQQIQEVFDFTGEIDSALAIQALRLETSSYCLPTIQANQKHIHAVAVYHPLVYQAVTNDIGISQKSLLLTGSNMSGKSTFIRAMGINVILGLTINTCFAREFVTPRMKVHSAIRVSDDLLNEKSYYFEEVITIKNLLAESVCAPGNLFLLDELFKGTNTIERIATGKAVLNYLNNGPNLVLVSTHDLELAGYLSETFDLYHFSEQLEKQEILFDYKLKKGILVNTNAIRILELNAYPPQVITDALQTAQQLKNEKLL